MKRPRCSDCIVGQHQQQYPSVSQRRSCPRQDSHSWTSSSSCRCRCRRRIAVWIALAMLLGCCGVTGASSVLPPSSTPTTDVEGRRAGDRLSRSSLLLLRPALSSHDSSDDRGLSVNEDFNEGYNVRHRQRHWHSASETCDKLSRRRRRRTRSMLNFVIILSSFFLSPFCAKNKTLWQIAQELFMISYANVTNF